MDAPHQQSVTHWLQLAADDDSTAQQQLWNRYFARLAALARARITGAPQRVADEEDVVLSAFNSFFSGARAGRFPELHDRTGLWPLLVKITARKAINQVKRQQAKKRSSSAQEAVCDMAQLVGSEPTPQFAMEVAEKVERLLRPLDDQLRTVAVMKLEGFSNAEIADRLGVVERSVERKLARIRLEWTDAADQVSGQS
ncbi:MAG: RNA polymerase subunit sigma-70 [Pirellulales bacterium]|nr:RNA polymerase subunit sigma-70 [Pirellulales bacterium]